jgi:hypothetical protein
MRRRMQGAGTEDENKKKLGVGSWGLGVENTTTVWGRVDIIILCVVLNR